jgi:integrase
MTTLAERSATAAAALRFAILTTARTNEVIGAKWNEIDFESQIWTVPAERMKASREHRVPLSAGALAIIESMRASRMNDFIFPGERAKKLSNMAMLMLLRRMKTNATVHGFRSSFRDWAGNETPYPREVCEAALAHVSGDSTEQAYRRSDALEKRRGLMQDWSEYLLGKAARAKDKSSRPRRS